MSAAPAGLTYTTDNGPGLTRKRAGKGFTYQTPSGETLRDKPTLARIRALGIPPAYTSVWINPDPTGHIQATGRDAKNRKQYRYHADWNTAQDATKFTHMLTFARMLPKLRRKVRADMAEPGLGRSKVIATVVNLLETTLIRVGNEDYARTNKSYGLSTLRSRHVKIGRDTLRFQFTGKSGKSWNLQVTDSRLAKVVKACQELPGQHLFQYLDDTGNRHAVTSQDINTYLRAVSGADITAKDFRTWAGTVLAAAHLRKAEAPTTLTQNKRTISTIIKAVSGKLGNTPAICRKCYIHPDIFICYEQGRLHEETTLQSKLITGLKTEENAVILLLTPTPKPRTTPKIHIHKAISQAATA